MVSLDLRDLFKEGVALRIGTRAFDILELLIRHQGQLVSKEQILQRVWPDTVVEENNLQVHISALRKALGSDRDLIRTIPGRGYLLLGGEGGVVDDVDSEEAPTTQWQPGVQGNRLPAGVDLVGRAALLGELNAALSDQHALITLIGPGGVGKTSLAVELGRQRLDARLSSVYFVALAELEHPDGLIEAISLALGIDVCAVDPLPFLIQQLAQRTGLLILDNCEHVIDQVAALVDAIRRSAPGLRVLATSREPLRIGGERSLQVPPLTLPEPDASRDAILHSDSAQVFLRHWRALDYQVAGTSDAELDDYSIDLVGEVCRRLDGIPLALEMAAARACALGLYQLVESLDESMHLLSASLRTAPPRQQTMQASLSWSYRLLSRDERTVLRHLADLDGRFTLEQACNALQCATLTRNCVMDCMVRLATKSLLMVSAQGPFRFYRMLAATRTCLRLGAAAERANEAFNPDPRGIDVPSSLANLHAARAVPVGPDGYHARHQRALAVGH
jgi:predicted ATPase/DNA-binding winged helix-turn-helix (wHTH) protein